MPVRDAAPVTAVGPPGSDVAVRVGVDDVGADVGADVVNPDGADIVVDAEVLEVVLPPRKAAAAE